MWLGFTYEFWIGAAIGVVGIVLTILLGRQKRRGHLSIGIIQSASLMSEVARKVPNLRVLYAEQEVQDELIWISGIFVNTGPADIGTSIVSQFPRLILDEGANWQEFSLVEAMPSDAHVSMNSPSSAEIRWSLLKPLESIAFSALIKTTDRKLEERLREASGMSVSARIENTDCEFEPEFSLPIDVGAIRRSFFFTTTFVVVAIIMAAFMFLPSRPEITTQYYLGPSQGWYFVENNNNGMLELTSTNGSSKKVLAEKSFHPKATSLTERVKPASTVKWVVEFAYGLFISTLAALNVYNFVVRYRRFKYLNRANSFLSIFKRGRS